MTTEIKCKRCGKMEAGSHACKPMTTEKKPCCVMCRESLNDNFCNVPACPCHASEGEKECSCAGRNHCEKHIKESMEATVTTSAPLDWKTREREKWHDTNEEKDEFGLASTMANEIADYWLGRITAIREETIKTMEKTIIEQINSAGGLGGMNHLRDMIEVAAKIARGE